MQLIGFRGVRSCMKINRYGGIIVKNCDYLHQALAWMSALKDDLLHRKSLGYLLLLTGIVVVASGVVIFIVDPSVHSLWDGVWYAWVTMTHVGYGDVVPTSFVGRLFASVLIMFGIAMLAIFTATFSAILIKRDVDAVEKEESEILAELKRLHERLDKLEGRK
jgi:voltage-gated potassium channel